MGQYYSHLTSQDRIALCALLKAGYSKASIARQLGVHRSTIYRELARNGTRVGYAPFLAECKIKRRYKRTFKLKRDAQLRSTVFSKLALGWSPERVLQKDKE